ncbi:SdrD B-like domain-containing protein [Staphylococcus delphini]|uniref:SdrD B-like domain-containing protein n=1 Tax=Staphylococcus delphini TaxID=53344 RepID=UPI000BBBFD3A|nr:SdrD B-like domain-containing protein [Staphylococcus delphini]PCF41658.1 hypothetical protein B5C06_08450 [Staphylococcus delphini]
MIMNKNTSGFLPNKQNKYAIRKYTVGTASLLIGATLVFGAHAEDAKAAEEATVDSHQTPDAQPEASEAPVTVDKATTPLETNEAPAPVTTEKVEAPVAEGKTTEAETTEAVAPKTEEKSAEAEEAAEVTSAVEEKAETTPATDQKEADKAPTTEEKTSAPVVEKVEAEPAVAPEKAATSSENAPTTAAPKMDQPEVGTLDGVPTTVDNFNQLASDEEKAEALANYYAKGTGLSEEAAAEKVKSINIDFSKVDAQKVLADMLVAFANEQDKNKVAATPVSLGSARPVMRMAVAAEQPSGQLITKDNGISNIKTTMVDVDKDNANGDGIIYPQNYGYVKIQTSFDVADSVKSGDTFKIKYNEKLQISDLFENRVIPPKIYNTGGEVIATGTYDVTSRTMTYTFTDYVDKHNHVKVALNLLAYVERDVVKEEGKYDFVVDVAGQTTTQSLDVKYQKPFVQRNVNLNSFYNEYDNVTGAYSQIAYINPNGQYLKQPIVEIKGYGGENNASPESSSAVISNTDKIQIYEVPADVKLVASYKPILTDLTLLEVGKNYELQYDNDKVTIKLKEDGTKRYVIYTEGQQDMESTQPLVQSVRLAATTEDNQYRSFAYSQNYIETHSASGMGQGEQTYKIGNRVWEDVNDNDVQDSADKGIADVVVTLKDAATNQVIGTTKTDSDGYYLFDKVKNGNYVVEFTDPATNGEGKKYVPVTERVGSDKEVDSDSRVVNVTIQDEDDLSIDRGFEVAPELKPATYELGDYVWIDYNNDGIQNQGEAAVKGVKVTLTKPDGSTMTTKTDKDGKYLFTGLENGEYTVTFSELPEGYEPTKTQVGDDKLDSNGLESKVTINNANNYSTDLGIVKPEPQPEPQPATYELGDYVWIDYNKDGIQNKGEAAVEGVTVTLTKPDGSTMTTKTDKDGKYLFTGLENGEYTVTFSELPEGYEPTKTQVGDDKLDSNGLESKVTIDNANNYSVDLGIVKPEEVEPPQVEATFNLGDKVWEDLNKDGIQNSNEPGIDGVTVTLTKEDGTTVTAKTDENGNYKFTELPNGKYTVTFETPDGYEPTKANVGDDALDSDGKTVEVVINNKDDMTIDSGFHKPEEVEPPQVEATFNLGDKVWEDLNKDGIQNSNEPGIGGVTVTLTKEDGTTVTTTTDENGNYKFTELPNGEYTVTFETPKGYEATKANVGDDALDSDGQTVKVIINNKDDMTIDSGFHKPTPEEPMKPTPEVPAQPGQPENPTPEKPEQPNNPTPEVPEQPGQPENPTPEKPEQPSNPTPEMPEQPGNPSPSMPNQPMNTGAHGEMSHDKAPKHEAKALPETGETATNQAPLFGGLLAALGALFVVGRRKKQKDQ